MEDVLRAIVLGIVQGLTEFLPISSSGHLIVTRELFGWDVADDLTFDVALHIGTTLALITFFWREWLLMARAALRWTANGGHEPEPDPVYNSRLLFLLFLGSIPTALVGLIFDLALKDEIRSGLVVGAMLVTFAAVLFAAENLGSRVRGIESCVWRDAAIIGAAQAISLIPGVSRAGVTITAALGLGFNRTDAARFSFLLATPIILGAGLLQGAEAAIDGVSGRDAVTIVVGAIAAAVVGWLAIRYLLRIVQSGTYMPFVVYRVFVGAALLVYFAV
jgi:undecaprenyl-diphosphatase